jgi:hypothetical protein
MRLVITQGDLCCFPFALPIDVDYGLTYFEGVQGDKSKQGELFGVKNIFCLDESGTMTKFMASRFKKGWHNECLVFIKDILPLEGMAESQL